ncbi:O-antigen five: acetylation of the O-antigen (LPS) [Escherichia coli M605]|uniref:O-antigen five: acetylation of the O-antigen (LPS) n=1 Tax=Escherichia coli M605 TaxID=656417 RepID=F4SV41_ECOLX|nr:acyltransferase family protein [Escherichia coli]EGI16863.1 O-antigen five: acetylation of the O-antigen (LPS) [Escherichia coli M605]ELK0522249.1 acyltransferase [Escherichia coli]HCN6289951.1 acyltransferase [Escherichia coli]
MTYKKFRLDINGLRAFAVISVVLYHFGVPYVSGGFVGVDVFFVISGFLMTGIVLERVDHKGVLDFYIARFLRIVPALLVVVITLMAFGMFALSTNEYEGLSRNAIASLLFYSNNYYAIHSSYFDPSSELNFLLHTWSLSAEWQFYILYPLLVILIKKLRLPVGLALSAIFTISLTITLMRVTGTREDIFYLLPTRAWEMLAGGLVYMASVRYKMPEWIKHCDGYGIALIVVAATILHSNGYWPSYSTFAPVLGASMVILANDQNSIFTSNRVAQWAGKISYSVYLWHWPVVVAMRYYQIDFSAINIFIGVVSSFALGELSYRIIESTLRKRARLIFNISLFAVALSACMFVMLTRGISFRFSDALKQVVEYRMDNSSWRPDTCFLNPEQDYTAFSKCQDKMTSKSFVVWGDSHAAHLMPGLRSVFGNDLNITQRSASLCPPIIGLQIDGRPHCKAINDMVAREISDNKPNTVLMSALWSVYPMRDYLPGTIKFLKDSGVKNIILVGPFPVWKKTLIDTIEETGVNAGRTVPWGMTDETRNLRDNDAYLRELAKDNSLTYISPLDTMCTESYCKAIIGHKNAYPVQFDFAHLTPEGSRWFIEEVEKQVSK